MHADSANLLINVVVIMAGILALGFLLWFLIALTVEKSGSQIRCCMEFELNGASSAINRQPIREVARPRSWSEDFDSVQPVKPAQILLTHRALRAVGQTDKSWQARPYLIH